MIIFSIDIDWAPEPIIQDTLDLFEEYHVKCTLFATHKSHSIDNCSRNLFEVGIHPNFNFLLEGKGGHYTTVIDDLLNIYPEAKGVRSHSITQNSAILDFFVKRGLVYDSNNLMPYQKNCSPFFLWNGLLKIPYVWEDDVHWEFGKSFDKIEIDLSDSSLKVFAFHPMHIFLNTKNSEMYNLSKPFYKDYVNLKKFVNTETTGARTALIELLKFVEKSQLESKTLIDFSIGFKKNNL